MDFDLDQRTARLSVGDLACFAIGPRDAGDGPAGLWRAQLGTRWHQELRTQTAAAEPAAGFEIAVAGQIFHAGWTLTLSGRIDQIIPAGDLVLLREIKTTLRPLPAPETELHADHPDYFAQLAAYVALARLAPENLKFEISNLKSEPASDPLKSEISSLKSPAGSEPSKSEISNLKFAPAARLHGELVFVEAGSGLSQTIALTPADDALFQARLTSVVEFLNLRLRARERLRTLRFHPAFSAFRAGQETTRADLDAALAAAPGVLFAAPTGFGKTGVLLECALTQLRAGRFSRLIYLTSKSTGQLHVMSTLQAMTAVDPETQNPKLKTQNPAATPVAAWLVRPKREHCVNPVFHCTRDACSYLLDLEARWPKSGLARFYLADDQPHDLESLRTAGREARLCPYEITRAALAFNDVWIGDYNYVFAPANRGIFCDQPGFLPAETLLVIDEAHNLPARAADAHSHTVRADDLPALLAELEHLSAPAPLARAVDAYARLLAALTPCDALDAAQEDDLGDALGAVAREVVARPFDSAALGPHFSELLWETVTLDAWLRESAFPRLLWCPRAGELRFTCLDAAALIGETLRTFGGVIFATATPGPANLFAEACGLEPVLANGQKLGDGAPPPRQSASPEVERDVPARSSPTKRAGDVALHPQSPALAIGNTRPPLASVTAHTPWREGAYDVAYDVRVNTAWRQRALHHATSAATVAALQAAAHGPIVVFFPSYAYAEAVQRELEKAHPELRAVRQPKSADLAAQTAWMEESLAFADVLFLVLGSGFAEGIDLLGGRVTHAMVVGPALPEVNAVQSARLDTLERAGLKRDAAFQRVYQVPGMQRVNQAVGRLVRAPGQHAKVLLHCRRFLEPSYAALLDPAYQFGATIHNDEELAAWLAAK